MRTMDISERLLGNAWHHWLITRLEKQARKARNTSKTAAEF